MAADLTPITTFAQSWEGKAGSVVKDWITSHLELIPSRVGFFQPLRNQQTVNNHYWLRGFADQASYELWAGDSDTYQDLLLVELEIPIAVQQGATYSVLLTVDRVTTNPIVVISPHYEIGYNYKSILIDTAGQSDADYNGTLIIERSIDGGSTWSSVGTVTISPKAMNDDTFDTLDIGPYLLPETRSQGIRLRAKFTVNDESGEVTAYSGNVTFRDITYTSLNLRWAAGVVNPIVAADQLALSYNFTGLVQRTLHITATDGTNTVSSTFTIPQNNYNDFSVLWDEEDLVSTPVFNIGQNGSAKIVTLEAYLTCNSGVSGVDHESDHITTQLLIIPEGDTSSTPYLLLQNVARTAKNYIQLDLCQYAVVCPNGENIVASVRFEITGSDPTDVYARALEQVNSGTLYTLPATIEIEDLRSTITEVNAWLHAYIVGNNTDWSNALIVVDTSENYAPTSGAVYVFNPKQVTDTSLNIVESEDGQRVLRVPAGTTVTLKDDNGDDVDWLAPFHAANDANVTLELDVKMRNVVNEDDPIVSAFEENGERFIGLKLMPLHGVLMTASRVDEPVQNFFVQEDERTHLAINIVSRLSPDGQRSLALCRIFINGVIQREFVYALAAGEWHVNGSQLIIGQVATGGRTAAADIDVYGVRLYNKVLSTAEIQQDYKSTLPTGTLKLGFKNRNEILSAGRIDAQLCKDNGLNTLIWHGDAATSCLPRNPRGAGSVSSSIGWWEIYIYDDNGNYLPEYSGSLGQWYDRNGATIGRLAAKRQGTTANTYYYSNIQTKMKDLKSDFEEEVMNAWVNCGFGTMEQAKTQSVKNLASVLPKNNTGTWSCLHGIFVRLSDIHEEYDSYVESTTQPGYAFVPCGWIDGNGKYRGPQYKMSADTPYASKLVAKINYASSMQSHLMGSCNLYNDLHTRIVGANTMQTSGIANARVAKKLLPFMLFGQGTSEATPVYNGPTAFGPGKMDDTTWGYSKSNDRNALFCMMEGADNDLPLTDFRTPWNKDYIRYNVSDDEVDGIAYYNGSEYEVNFDLDRFKGVEREIVNQSEVTMNIEAPSLALEQKIKDFVNFVYRHNPRINVYIGNWNAFENTYRDDDDAKTYKWWCTAGDDAFKLRRWDYAQGKWVEAGWSGTTDTTADESVLNISTVYGISSGRSDYEQMNKELIQAIAAEALTALNNSSTAIINAESLKFHYAFVNQFIAGTDNCSKNTYYVLDYGTGKWELHQDDMDTIFHIDNEAHLTKPYYIDRQHPYAEDDVNEVSILYRGGANALFNMCEEVYGNAIPAMMNTIFSRMSDLGAGSSFSWIGDSERATPWGCLWKYFFSIQKYFPETAYNEAARIRYEIPEAEGFRADQRGTVPITQSIGDQLQCELQYMKRRLVLFASYAQFGDFSNGTGSTGLADAVDNFGLMPKAVTPFWINGFIPHQYIYPTASVGTSARILSENGRPKRCKPGQPYDWNIGNNGADTGSVFYGTNYYRSLGTDLGKQTHQIVEQLGSDYSLSGKRLTELTISPAVAGTVTMRIKSLTLNTPLIETLDLRNESTLTQELDLSKCLRLRSIDLRGTGITSVILPQSENLVSVHLPTTITALSVRNCPNLSTLDMTNGSGNEDYSGLESLSIVGCGGFDSYHIIELLQQAGTLQHLAIDGVNWTSASRSTLMWAAGVAGISSDAEHAELRGTIHVAPSANITLADKILLGQWYGDIDNGSKGLTITYDSVPITRLTITAPTFMWQAGTTYNATPTPEPTTGNDIALNADGSPDIVWKIVTINDDVQTEAKPSYVAIADAINGLFAVGSRAVDDERTFYLVATLTKTNGTSIDSEPRRVLFYRRKPQVGDFAYADGSFDSVLDSSHDVVGQVFMVSGIKNDNTIDINLQSGTQYKAYRVRVVAKSDLILRGSYTMQWGPQGNASPWNVAAVSSGMSAAGLSCNAPGVYETTSNGVGHATEANLLDTSTEPPTWKTLSGAAGDYAGKANTEALVAYANRIINNYLNSDNVADGDAVLEGYSLDIDTEAITSLTALEAAIATVAGARADQEGTTINGSAAYLCPAAYGCHLYVPSHPKDTLHDAYTVGNWYLPAEGELARLCYYYKLGGIFKTGGATGWTTDYRWSSTEYNASLAWFVSFSNAYLNYSNKASNFRCRPVAAFDFEL